MRGVCRPKRLRRRLGHMTGMKTVRPKPRVTEGTAAATLLRAPSIPSEPRSVTPLPGVSWTLPARVPRPGRSGPRRKRSRNGSSDGEENCDHQCTGASVHGIGGARSGAMGRSRARARTARTSERTEDMDRASAGPQRARQANAVIVGCDVGRGCATCSACADRGGRGRRPCAGIGATDADVRTGVPCGLRRAVEAKDQGGARAQYAALHPIGTSG